MSAPLCSLYGLSTDHRQEAAQWSPFMVLISSILLTSPALSDRTKLMQFFCQKMLSSVERPRMQSEGSQLNIVYGLRLFCCFLSRHLIFL